MKAIVITGATSGIGLETARVFTDLGYLVIGIGHSEKNCEIARNDILTANPNAKITFYYADLMQRHETLRIAEEIKTYFEKNQSDELCALINNAGCVRSWYMTTEEGYEQQFALNHLAGFLLTHELLTLLKKWKGKILFTGSESHKGIKIRWDDVMFRRGYNPLTAYKQSKLCNILFAKGLNDRYNSYGVQAYVVDPGLVNTDIGNKKTGGIVNLVWTLRKRYGVSPAVPAKTYAFLCEQTIMPNELYYRDCAAASYSKEVTTENADSLFALSERLCEISYYKRKED